QKVKRHAQAVDVGPGIDAVAIKGLLRSEVVGGAEDRSRIVLAREVVALIVEESREAEVEDLDCTGAVEQDVARFDVAVHQPLVVGVLQPEARLKDVVAGAEGGERALLPDDFLQAIPLNVLHDEVVQLAVAIDIVDLDDVGMIEDRDGARLALEALDDPGVLRLGAGKHLQGDASLETDMLAQEDGAHAALGKAFEQFEFVADEEVSPLALKQLIGLEARQQSVADHRLGEVLGRSGHARSGAHLLQVVVQPFLIENAAFLAQVKEFVDRRWCWHRPPSGSHARARAEIGRLPGLSRWGQTPVPVHFTPSSSRWNRTLARDGKCWVFPVHTFDLAMRSTRRRRPLNGEGTGGSPGESPASPSPNLLLIKAHLP